MKNKIKEHKKIILSIVGVVLVVASWNFLPLKDYVQTFRDWIISLGFIGYIVFTAFYSLSVVVLFPGSLMTLIAGLSFGFIKGLIVTLIGATLGASISFLSARYLFTKQVNKYSKNHEKFKAFMEAIDENGWKVVCMLRLSPVLPFSLQNFFYGLTKIKLRNYCIATIIGIIPGSAMYVYLGTTGASLLEESSSGGGDPALKWTFTIAGLLVTAFITWYVSKKAEEKIGNLSKR